MKADICGAIAEKRLLQFVYDDERRVVEPHLVGTSRRDKQVLSAYQVEGGSVSGDAVGWKTFEFAKIESLVVLDSQFVAVRLDYNRTTET